MFYFVYAGHGNVDSKTAYLALEDAEEPRFRLRFGGQRFGGLDWPPLTVIEAPARVRFYETARRY